MNDLIRQLRWIALLTIGGLLVIFVVQNAARIELQLLVWTVSSRRAFLVLACIAIGFLLGWLFGYTARRR